MLNFAAVGFIFACQAFDRAVSDGPEIRKLYHDEWQHEHPEEADLIKKYFSQGQELMDWESFEIASEAQNIYSLGEVFRALDEDFEQKYPGMGEPALRALDSCNYFITNNMMAFLNSARLKVPKELSEYLEFHTNGNKGPETR